MECMFSATKKLLSLQYQFRSNLLSAIQSAFLKNVQNRTILNKIRRDLIVLNIIFSLINISPFHQCKLLLIYLHLVFEDFGYIIRFVTKSLLITLRRIPPIAKKQNTINTITLCCHLTADFQECRFFAKNIIALHILFVSFMPDYTRSPSQFCLRMVSYAAQNKRHL